MSGNDRFGPEQDYAETYRRLGGSNLADRDATDAIRSVIAYLIEAYDSGCCDDDFPTVADAIVALSIDLAVEDGELIDDVIAEHEVGGISETHRDTIRELARTYSLGIISNVFAQPSRFEHNLLSCGLFACFQSMVWSSFHRAIKPSPLIFDVALSRWGLEPERILYVGNDARRDIGGAKQVGMLAAWINLHSESLPDGIPGPDIEISNLSDLPGELT